MARHQPSPNRTPRLIARPAISGLLVAATAVFWAQPAMADDVASATATSIEQTADLVAPAVDVISGAQSASGSVTSVGEDASTLAPASGAGDVVLTGESGIPFAVGLPAVAEDANAALAEGGSIVYDDPDGLADIVVQPLDSGMRIETIIKSADAPTSYAFDLSDGIAPMLNPDGSVDLVASAGGVSLGIGHVAPPWAVDASGMPVRTEFAVADGHLSQVVHHVGVNTVYPVVADPSISYGVAIYLKYSASEVRSQASGIRGALSQGSAYVAGAACQLLRVPSPVRYLCSTLTFTVLRSIYATFLSASDSGKCVEIQLAYVSMIPLGWKVYSC
jgi:hypothetical protein